METTLFYIFGGMAVVTALLMVTRQNPIFSAVWLVVSFFAFAVLFLMLDAQFVAVLQILLYAGAIMVLFIFVIMLLNVRAEELKPKVMQFSGILGGGAAIYLIVLFTLGILKEPVAAFGPVPADFGYVAPVGRLLFTKYLIPFELTSVLLLVAIVGSVVMGKRKL
ncbi:MAG: NADH-quinone oxidoreductase subunit J [bacterium]|nr:NADH-quinone oxidoreductase subunit J [bacterium]